MKLWTHHRKWLLPAFGLILILVAAIVWRYIPAEYEVKQWANSISDPANSSLVFKDTCHDFGGGAGTQIGGIDYCVLRNAPMAYAEIDEYYRTEFTKSGWSETPYGNFAINPWTRIELVEAPIGKPLSMNFTIPSALRSTAWQQDRTTYLIIIYTCREPCP